MPATSRTLSCNEYHGLLTLTQNSDEQQDEHAILLAPALESSSPVTNRDRLLFQGLGELDAPLPLHLGDAQQDRAQDADDQAGEDGERAFPVVLCVGPLVLPEAVEGADKTAADDQIEEEAKRCAVPDLGRGLYEGVFCCVCGRRPSLFDELLYTAHRGWGRPGSA